MPFEEFAPAKPPSAQAVRRDEVVLSVRPHLRSTKDERFRDRRMVEVTIGASVVMRLGWADTGVNGSKPCNAKVLFGTGPDLGKMQIARGSTVSYKLRYLKGGAVKFSISAMPAGAPATEFKGKSVAFEVLRPAAGSDAYLLVTLPVGFLPSAVDRRKAG